MAILFLGGCSKKENQGVTGNDKNKNTSATAGAKLNFVASVSEIQDGATKDGATNISLKASFNSPNKTGKVIAPQIVSSGGIDAVLSVEQKNTPATASVSALKAVSTRMLPASAFTTGFKYRLLIYSMKPDGSSPVFVSSTLLTMGGSPNTVAVNQGQNYTWYAYSYNDANDVADVADYSNPTAPTIVNRDLLFATGTVATQAAPPGQIANSSVALTFSHMSSRIGVVLNAKGMFAGINSGTVQIDPTTIELGTFNFKTSSITNSAPAPAGTPLVSSQVVKQYKTGMLDTAKFAYFYSSSVGKQLTNVKATVNAFTLALDDGSTRAFTGLSSVFTFPTVTPTSGESVTLKIDLVESSINMGGIKYGRANLYFDAAGKNAWVFRHYPDNRYTGAALNGEFWNYGTATPGGTRPSSAPAIDPCSLVYPRGAWRLPTNTESRWMGNTMGSFTSSPGANPSVFNANYPYMTLGSNFVDVIGRPTNIGSPYPSSLFHIQYKGFSDAGNKAPSLFVDQIVLFWDSSELTSIYTNNFGFISVIGNTPFPNGTGKFIDILGNPRSQLAPNNGPYGYGAEVNIQSGLAACIRCVRTN